MVEEGRLRKDGLKIFGAVLLVLEDEDRRLYLMVVPNARFEN